MNKDKRKKSFFIQPIIAVIDVLVINFTIYFIANTESFTGSFLLYLTILWLLISYYNKFYSIHRYTHITKLLTLILAQFFIFILAFFAYFTIFKEGKIIHDQFITLTAILLGISFFKLFSFYLLKRYRLTGKNFRNVIVFGESKAAQNIASLFSDKQDLGYRFIGFFSDKINKSKNHLGTVKEGFQYSLSNIIDEIYCDPNSVSQYQLKEIRFFCAENEIDFRLVPDNKAIYSKDFILEYYGTLPVLKPKKLPFERIETHILKRFFDILFSLTICVFLLSWFLPIVWVFVTLNSRGTFFFKQLRDGVDGKQFYCYKIRSMKKNELSDKVSATENDSRVTKVGAFLRKTSLDELPQFFNVLLGDMSIVGPRPHMNIQTQQYLKEIDNYLVRNSVKPGITGLAQISGFRGEVKKKSDIENRVRLDIFYIENWSFFLDIKIIFQTVFSVFKGEEKAY
ncbi:exopolysaccharide biosynthesis polyprenyl glycosylphosphotransferase [uncultured Polaribacter sp.]|uniref:exopolysaccharide biosynthesis polyprenyl glycosylphosphotransferase n=1 Tax=uncultured Polaribacter sp. TaxID=174711 RepID=UPI002607D0BA|nr:exopolysaccharide biosynthesis polyprenyl glycosylphosphotransferase [uncultured Polaribacter sp.]